MSSMLTQYFAMKKEQNPMHFDRIVCDHSQVVRALIDSKELFEVDTEVEKQNTVKIIHEKKGQRVKEPALDCCFF